MSTCTSADIAIFNTTSDALNTCVTTAQGTAIFPTADQVNTCMIDVGVSTGCTNCWSNLFGDFKTCFIDTCDFSEDTPVTAEVPQACVDCLAALGTTYYASQSICGVNMTDIPVNSGDTIGAQISKWSAQTNVVIGGTVSSSAGGIVSVRSVATTMFVFGLLMIGI